MATLFVVVHCRVALKERYLERTRGWSKGSGGCFRHSRARHREARIGSFNCREMLGFELLVADCSLRCPFDDVADAF